FLREERTCRHRSGGQKRFSMRAPTAEATCTLADSISQKTRKNQTPPRRHAKRGSTRWKARPWSGSARNPYRFQRTCLRNSVRALLATGFVLSSLPLVVMSRFMIPGAMDTSSLVSSSRQLNSVGSQKLGGIGGDTSTVRRV